MFDGLKLRVAPEALSGQRGEGALGQAVQRYSRTVAEVMKMRAQDMEALPHQRVALGNAAAKLNQIRPDAARDLSSAFGRDRTLVDEAAKGHTTAAIRAMMLESEVRTDPALRAERFVEGWQKLQGKLQAVDRARDAAGLRRVGSDMSVMAKSLERDPQVESLLRKRLPELGISISGGASLSHDLQERLGISRGLGLGR